MIFKSNLSKNTIFIRLLFLFSLSGLLYSQSINGFVREESSGEPISYANIFLENTSLGAATNRDGYFVISDIPMGSYTLNASMIGYGIFKKEITINDSGSIRLTIFLDQEVISTYPMYQRAQKGIGYLAQEESVFRKLSVEDNILGVLEFFKACSQHSIVSILSAGLKTFKFGIDLKLVNCSIG